MSDLLKTGDLAPDFTLLRDGGDSVKLSDYSGRILVLFFYPKDNTPGCTREAKEFTELVDEFKAAGADILGMSADTVKRHDNFIAKHDLKIPLAADPELETLKAYGIWQQKKMYGREYMGIVRTTMLIAADGKIARVWNKVKVAGHASEVLDAARQLTAG